MLITNNTSFIKTQDLKSKDILNKIFDDCTFLLPTYMYSYYDCIRIKKIDNVYVFDFIESKIRNKAYNSFFIELSKIENLKKIVNMGKNAKTIKELMQIFRYNKNTTNLPEDTVISYGSTYYTVIVENVLYEYNLREVYQNKQYKEVCVDAFNPNTNFYELTKKWEIDIKYAKQFKF